MTSMNRNLSESSMFQSPYDEYGMTEEEILLDSYYPIKTNVAPWNHYGSVNPSLPSFSVEQSMSYDGPEQLQHWNSTTYSPTSSIEGSPLQYPTSVNTQTPPSLSDLESMIDTEMSRTPSFASPYTQELHGGISMARLESGHSQCSNISDNMLYKDQMSSYEPYPTVGTVRKNRSSSSASQHYLSVPTSHEMTNSYSQQSLSSVSSVSHPTAMAGHVIKTADGKERALLPTYKTSDTSSSSRKQIRKAQFTCNHCDERPDGFRGEHELTRHVKLRHEPTRKMWICVPTSDNLRFLVGCKNCDSGKKYGAYYNAAQHVRRCHFHPIKRGRKAKSESSSSCKQMSSSRERNYPPMSEMKKYLCEITTDNEGNILDRNEATENHLNEKPNLNAHDDHEDFNDVSFISLDTSSTSEVSAYNSLPLPGTYGMDETNWVIPQHGVNLSGVSTFAQVY